MDTQEVGRKLSDFLDNQSQVEPGELSGLVCWQMFLLVPLVSLTTVKFSLLMKWKSGTCELSELFTVMRSHCPTSNRFVPPCIDSWSGLMSMRGSSGDYRQQQDLQSQFSEFELWWQWPVTLVICPGTGLPLDNMHHNVPSLTVSKNTPHSLSKWYGTKLQEAEFVKLDVKDGEFYLKEIWHFDTILTDIPAV